MISDDEGMIENRFDSAFLSISLFRNVHRFLKSSAILQMRSRRRKTREKSEIRMLSMKGTMMMRKEVRAFIFSLPLKGSQVSQWMIRVSRCSFLQPQE